MDRLLFGVWNGRVVDNRDVGTEAIIFDRLDDFDEVEMGLSPEEVRAVVADYSPEYVEKITGIPAADLRRAARLYAAAPRPVILHAMGTAQHIKYPCRRQEVSGMLCHSNW